MSILIKGMEMPKDGEMLCINIYPDGKVCIDLDLKCKQIATAVPVPTHGALMDRDDFFATCPELVDGYKRITDDLVVIPASEDGE